MQKRIFITGAASGIGRATANASVQAGWFVGAYDINEAAVSDWVESAGAQHACAGALDVVNAEHWRVALARFEAATGGIDVLVNTASAGRAKA